MFKRAPSGTICGPHGIVYCLRDLVHVEAADVVHHDHGALFFALQLSAYFPDRVHLLLTGVILHGIYTPIAIKFGIAKAKIVSVISIITVCLMPTTIVRVLDTDMNSVFSFLKDPPALIAPVFFGADIIIFILSMIISIRIFEKKEL